jgi:uncharacterized protein (TIGR02996 family)
MSLPEAFRQVILEAPEDDVPRLVYADWLEENDQPARADFIRAGCQLARLAENDRRRAPLEDREQALLDEHGTTWRAELPVSLPVKGVTFRRGFVERVDLTAEQFLAHADDLFRSAPVRTLRLRGCAGRLAEVVRHSALDRVRSLEIGANQLRPPDVEALAASSCLGGLETLDLRLNFLGDEGVRALARCRFDRLRRLQLGLNQMTEAGLQALLESPSFPALAELDLNNHAPPGSPEFCQSASGFTMYWNPISDEFARLIAGSPLAARLTALELDGALYMHGTGVGDEGCQELARSPFLTNLTVLDLSGGSVTAEGVRALTGAANLGRLRRLLCYYDALDDEALTALAGPGLPSLEVLAMAGGEFTDEGLARLAGSANRSKLTDLGLGECLGFGAAGVSALARAPHLARLTVLALNGNRVEDEGAVALASATCASSLARLYLSDASIGPDGARALASSDALAGLLELDLANNPLKEAAALLRRRFGRRVRLERVRSGKA